MALAQRAETLWLEACEHYQKGSYRNRCHIAGPNGIQRLSIPLQKGKNHQMPIRDVRISYDEPWQRIHWRSIQTAYGNAPFFEHYADAVAHFLEKPYTFLFDLNLEIVHFLAQQFSWTKDRDLTKDYVPAPLLSNQSAIQDMRGQITPKRPSAFALSYYPQVFEDRFGFLPDLSALDLLFCCGPLGLNAWGAAPAP